MGVTNDLQSGMILLAEAHSTQVWLVTGSPRPGRLRWNALQLKNPLLQTCNSFWNVWLPQIFLPTKKQKQQQNRMPWQKPGVLYMIYVEKKCSFFWLKKKIIHFITFSPFLRRCSFFLGCPKMVENVASLWVFPTTEAPRRWKRRLKASNRSIDDDDSIETWVVSFL